MLQQFIKKWSKNEWFWYVKIFCDQLKNKANLNMWNMMCDVMPTISEDSISQRSSQFGDDANFEQLMVSMLDERDKLVDSLKNEQEKTGDLETKVKDLEKERDSLQRQLNQNLPQVCWDKELTTLM